MDNLLKVGIADMKVAKSEDGVITYALGSCVGVALYDSAKKISGLVHVMLPEPGKNSKIDSIAKYATTGVPELIKQMVGAGAMKSRITAKIAGGARMFTMKSTSGIGDIGRRNAEMVKTMLKREGIRLLGEDCGADYARTMVIFRADGRVEIKSYGHDQKVL